MSITRQALRMTPEQEETARRNIDRLIKRGLYRTPAEVAKACGFSVFEFMASSNPRSVPTLKAFYAILGLYLEHTPTERGPRGITLSFDAAREIATHALAAGNFKLAATLSEQLANEDERS